MCTYLLCKFLVKLLRGLLIELTLNESYFKPVSEKNKTLLSGLANMNNWNNEDNEDLTDCP